MAKAAWNMHLQIYYSGKMFLTKNGGYISAEFHNSAV